MHELTTPPDAKSNISQEFLEVFNKLKKSTEAGRIFELVEEPTKGESKLLTDNYGNEIGLARLNQKKAGR